MNFIFLSIYTPTEPTYQASACHKTTSIALRAACAFQACGIAPKKLTL
jgi:hypothetical protein